MPHITLVALSAIQPVISLPGHLPRSPRRGRCLAFALCLVFMAFAMVPVQAQESVPRSVDPGQIERRFEAPPERKKDVAPLIPGVERQLTPEAAENIRFTLAAVVVEGVTAYPPETFAPLYEDMLATEVSAADMFEIARKITDRYEADGYLLSRAVIPEQKVALGVIRIKVIEGYLENIVFEGSIEGSTALLETYARKITEVQPLRVDVLERYILLMNDLPGLTAERRLVGIEGKEGAHNLIITVDHDTAYGFARFDNRGSRYVGPYQLWAGGGMNSLFGGWDNTELRAVTATQTDELKFVDVSHSRIVGDEGTRLRFGASVSETEPGHTLKDDGIESMGLFGSMSVEHALVRSRKRDLFVGAAINVLNSERDEFGVRTIDDRVRVLRLWVRAGLVDEWGGRNNASVYFSQGLDVLDATDAGDPLSSRTGAPADFTKAVFDLSRYQEITPRWGVMANVGGQRSGTKLFLSEQYGIGGETFGRAYDPSEIAGDDAIAAKLEVQWTSPFGDDVVQQHQFFAYYDYGATWFRSSADEAELASAGAGVRLLIDGGYFASLELAKPLTRSVEALGEDGNDARFFFVLSSNF